MIHCDKNPKLELGADGLYHVCGWCRPGVGKTDINGHGVSHGICPECLEKEKQKLLKKDVAFYRQEGDR